MLIWFAIGVSHRYQQSMSAYTLTTERELYYDLKIITLPNIIILLAYKRVRIVEDTPYCCRLIRLIVFYCIQWAIIAYFLLLLLGLSVSFDADLECKTRTGQLTDSVPSRLFSSFSLTHAIVSRLPIHEITYARANAREREREGDKLQG